MQPFVWLILLAVFMVLEVMTAGLTVIWFAGGSLVAFILGACGLGTVYQVAGFIVVSLLLLIFTRPIALKYINRRAGKTNVPERIIGRKALVTEEINNVKATGKVTVDGMPWTARTRSDAEIIPVGTEVVVEALSGVKVIVRQELTAGIIN